MDRNADRDKVLAASDIVDVVGDHVQLRPKGREFVSICCFHDDTKPSMYVSPQKQIFKCFACGAGGSVFDFVMKYHKLTFPEALKYLADRAGIELAPWKKRGGGPKQEGPSDRERQSEANAQALRFFAALLDHPEHGREASAYLQGRGVSAEMIQAFQIGVAPDRWDGLATMVGHKSWDVAAFVSIGLIKPRGNRGSGIGDRGSEQTVTRPPGDSSPTPDTRHPIPDPADCYDLLRHRLVFPIHDALGRPVAFGGRKLRDEDEPKYLNSPESQVFKKAGTLYGLHLAKKRIIDTKTAVMVEGYTDVIACHQAGATNVVAALGTALTPEHAKVLKRFCEKVVLVMDGDAAGQNAADRAIEVFLTAEVDVFLATIPGGADPDELLKQEGGLEQWNALVDGAKDALEWQFDRLAEQLDAAGTVTGRQRLAEAFAQRVVDAGLARAGSLRRSFVVQRLAQLLGLDREAVGRLLDGLRPRRVNRPPLRKPAERPRTSHPQPGSDDLSAEVYDRVDDVAGELDFDPGLPEGVSGDVAGSSHPNFSDVGGVSIGFSPANEASSADASVASSISRGKLKGLQTAERRVLAGLLARPELFSADLPDGRSIDESIAPAEFVTDIHRGVYQRLFDALCDGQRPTLAGLLTELSAEGRTDLADALSAADAELTPLVPHDDHGHPDPDALKQVLTDACTKLLHFHEERQYQETKHQLIAEPASPPAPESALADDPAPAPAPPADNRQKLAQLQALIDQRKTDARPQRIGKAPRD